MSIAVEEVKDVEIVLKKRQYVPIIVRVDCPNPNCGSVICRDLTNSYLSYPVVGEEVEMFFECEDCYYNFEVQATLNLTLSNFEYGNIDKYEGPGNF